MPTRFGHDSHGCFARWGNKGKKYYYKCGNRTARQRAKSLADKQGRAIKAI